MRKTTLAIGSMLAVACSTAPKGQVVQSIPADSTEYYRTQVQQIATVSAAKDSLFRDLAETTKLLADINTELAKVGGPKRAVEPVVSPESQLSVSPSDRQLMLKKVRDLSTRVRASESRLAASQRRIKALTGEGDSLRTTVADLQSTLDGLKTMVESQKTSIANLESELNNAKQQIVTLAGEKQILNDTVSAMTTRENTVYYIAGTKKELKDKGIIKEVGGTRFLIFTRTGESLKPAENLNPAAFTAIDRRQVSQIPLPNPDKEYRVITAQNVAYANVPAEAKGKVKGSLQISNAENFWTNSKFLILVEN